MEKTGAESISARDLASKIKTAVDSALKRNNFRVTNSDVSFFPDPGVLGFILDDPEINGKTFSELDKLKSDIATEVQGMHANSALILSNRGPIVGFFPVAEITLRE